MSVFLHRLGLLKPVAAPASYSFNMTAGDFFTFAQGYEDGTYAGGTGGTYGSIDAEPISGETLIGLISSGGQGSVAFDGDVTSLVSGLSIWVDSTEYTFTTDWAYSGGTNETAASWSSGAPTFVNTNMYFVEIK